jgi:hypothetical protein
MTRLILAFTTLLLAALLAGEGSESEGGAQLGIYLAVAALALGAGHLTWSGAASVGRSLRRRWHNLQWRREVNGGHRSQVVRQ